MDKQGGGAGFRIRLAEPHTKLLPFRSSSSSFSLHFSCFMWTPVSKENCQPFCICHRHTLAKNNTAPRKRRYEETLKSQAQKIK